MNTFDWATYLALLRNIYVKETGITFAVCYARNNTYLLLHRDVRYLTQRETIRTLNKNNSIESKYHDVKVLTGGHLYAFQRLVSWIYSDFLQLIMSWQCIRARSHNTGLWSAMRYRCSASFVERQILLQYNFHVVALCLSTRLATFLTVTCHLSSVNTIILIADSVLSCKN